MNPDHIGGKQVLSPQGQPYSLIQIEGIRLVKNKGLNGLNMYVNVSVVLKAFQNTSLIVGIEVGTNGLNLCVIRLHMRCNFSEMKLATRT